MRGQADYGALAAKETTAAVSDMGEVAARLGSIVTYDKRGDVVDFDSCEDAVLRWAVYPGTVNDYARLDSTSVKSGSQAIRLHSDNVSGAGVTITRGIPVLASKRLGFEVSFSRLSTGVNLQLLIYYFTGVKYYLAALKLDNFIRKLYVWNIAGGWTEVADSGYLFEMNFLFSTVKLVADFEALLYQRLLFNPYEHDISSIPLYSFLNTAAPHIMMHISLNNLDAAGGDVWIEDIVWTQAEP